MSLHFVIPCFSLFRTVLGSILHGIPRIYCYNIDIAALIEIRYPDHGQLTEEGAGYTFFWSGWPIGEPRQSGVGLVIKKTLTVKPRVESHGTLWAIANMAHGTKVGLFAYFPCNLEIFAHFWNFKAPSLTAYYPVL